MDERLFGGNALVALAKYFYLCGQSYEHSMSINYDGIIVGTVYKIASNVHVPTSLLTQGMAPGNLSRL